MKLVPNAVSVKAARSILKTQKASPQLLFVAGIVGFGATVVLACRATLKVDEVLEKHEKTMLDIQEIHREGYAENSTEAKKDKTYVYLRTFGDLSKLYGPTVIVGAASIAALAGSHNILNKRNAALAAAYTTLEKAFGGYRDRVREAYGEEREKELYHNVLPCELEDENTGKIVKKKVANGTSPYARLFDEHNKNWESVGEYNWLFLKMKQSYFNDQLQARGHLFLNEVYDELGFERSKEGCVVGWVKGNGDNYVDLGIFQEHMEERIVDFMIGREKAIWLDFNVDGLIYDKI